MDYSPFLGQDFFDVAIQLFGRVDKIGDVLSAAQGVALPATLTVKTDGLNDARITDKFASLNFTIVNSDFGIEGLATLGIPIMVVGTTFTVR